MACGPSLRRCTPPRVGASVDLGPTLPRTLLARTLRASDNGRVQTRASLRITRPSCVRKCPQRPVGTLELLGLRVVLMLDQGQLADTAV